MKFISFIFTVLILFTIFLNNVSASPSNITCSNRYLTLVNPVRSRDMWGDKTTKPLKDQFNAINDNKLKATWLLQYSALLDDEILDFLINNRGYHETGLFLEVDKKLANDTKVIYPSFVPWASPAAIFLSAYDRSERIELIDKLFKTFKNKFEKYPESVGAWWIDSYSLNYMKEKYGIKSAMIVADQKTTDHYGVWGQWWGFAYKPTKTNILVPAGNINELEDVVVVQWAQRDPDKAYGDGPKYSNYSLQANDYIRQGLDTKYFSNLVERYLDCTNSLAQVTVGLETGMESMEFINEYRNQLSSLKLIDSLEAVTMSEFADRFSQLYTINPEKITLKGSKSVWVMDSQMRYNKNLGDVVIYDNSVPFSDYFVKDSSNFLDRRLKLGEVVEEQKIKGSYIILALVCIIFLYFNKSKKLLNFFAALLFLVACFGLVLKSGQIHGWMVYFGPKIQNLSLVQFLLTFLVLIFFYKFKNRLLMFLIPLSFGFDYVLQLLRYTFISDRHYFGIAINPLRMLGISISDKFELELFNQEFPFEIADAFIKFDYNKIWGNHIYAFVVFPITHILIAYILYRLLKASFIKKRYIIYVIMIVLVFFLVLHVFQILSSDPLEVIKI